MKLRTGSFIAALLLCAALIIVATTHAHNPGYTMQSPGLPGASITINGIEAVGEWTGAASVPMADYAANPMMPGNPLSGNVRALHKSDGVYLLIHVIDGSNNPNDTVQVRFDINHNGTAGDAADWGIEVKRDGTTPIWGAGQDAATWAPVPMNTAVRTTTGADWKVEIRLPTGAPSNLSLASGTVGIFVQLFDIDQVISDASTKFNQWPAPPPMDLNALLIDFPNLWGDYVFDAATTFPNLSVTGVRRGGGVPSSDYYKISHTQDNVFEVSVHNPGGTAINDANNVRLNLYIAARGMSEPFHRLDQESTIDGDCNPAVWRPNQVLAKNKVCTGNGAGATSLVDISNGSITDLALVNGTADYTVKEGASRSGGSNITVNGGDTNTLNVVTWNTINAQDPKFAPMTVNGTTYNRQHQCMKAEALFDKDPNIADNTRQVNMDFVCVPGGGGGGGSPYMFGIGWAGFANYNPAIGKDLLIQAEMKNMNPQFGWNFKLSDSKGQIKQIKDKVFVAQVKGTQSIGAQVDIIAPAAETLGRTLKENLIIPAKAGGRQPNVPIQSGLPPVYVKVNPGSTLLISNYTFHDHDDIQFVDLDGSRPLLPPNGPAGLPNSLLQKVLDQVPAFKLLIAPGFPIGSFVGSWDNFRTSFLIGEGAQVKVPAGAQFLALGINGAIGLFDDNSGPGFRVKVVERAPGAIVSNDDGFSLIPTAYAQPRPDPRPVIPISEIMPTLCLHGYENTNKQQTVAGKKRELLRYIGNVCWGVVNVFPPNRSDKPDQGDKFEDRPKGGCGRSKNRNGLLMPFLFAVVGIGIIGVIARRRR